MIKQTLSTASAKNNESRELKRIHGRESNSSWLVRALSDMRIVNNESWSFVLLLGGKDTSAFRVRFAQSPNRRDLLPSYWSDAILLDNPQGQLEQATLIRLPLLQPGNEKFAPARNGLVIESINKLPNQVRCPNIAVLAVPIASASVMAAANTYRNSRQAYDAVRNILPWLAFIWSSGDAENPLQKQIGLPSAVMINQLFSTLGFDLAPGVNSQMATPEAFWSAASYWQEYYRETQSSGESPKARYVIGHFYDIDES